MKQSPVFRKGIALLIPFLFLFLSSCSAPVHRWHSYELIDCGPSFQVGKMYLSPQNEFNGMELELMRGSYGIRLYANIYSIPIPEDPSQLGKINITLIIDNETSTIQADRLTGGQRLLFPQYTTQCIIQALQNNQTVEISCGRYHTTVIPTEFVQHYQQLTQ